MPDPGWAPRNPRKLPPSLFFRVYFQAMAGVGGRRRTTWGPGKSGNPNGRPKGRKDIYPNIRLLLAEMVTSEDPALWATIAKCLRSPDHVTKILGLYSKLNFEHPPPALVLQQAAVAAPEVRIRILNSEAAPIRDEGWGHAGAAPIAVVNSEADGIPPR